VSSLHVETRAGRRINSDVF